MNKTDVACKPKLGLAPNSFFMVIPFLRDIKHWIKLKRQERLMYQQGLDQRARRASERESYVDYNSPQYRGKHDRTPVDTGRHRRDSDRTASAKMSLKKSLSRPDSKLESRKSQEKEKGAHDNRGSVSPFKTPQSSNKTSRKQLFSESSAANIASQAGTEKRKKKKSADKHILPDNFMPKAWKNFHLDQDLILKLAF